MSLEQQLDRLADSFDNMAAAINNLTTSGGIFQQPVETTSDEKPSVESEDKPKPAKKTTKKKAAAKKEKPKEEAADPEDDPVTQADVRAVLSKLSKVDSGGPKRILKELGVEGLSKLPEDQYQEAIDAAQAALDE